MDRKWLLGLGAATLVVLILAVVVVFGGAAGGPADAARAFFAAIPSGGPQAAYAKAAPAFRSATTPDAWAATASQHDLSQYASSTWDDSGKGGTVVTLTGVLNLKQGGVQPATVRVVKGADGWAVYSLDLPTGGVSGTNAGAAASAAVAPAVTSGAGPAPVAPTGAPEGTTSGQAGVDDSGAPVGAPPPGYPPVGYPPASGQASAPTLIPGRVAHDCGPHLLRLPGVQSIDVHCVDGISAVPGARGQCQALVNGRPTNVSVVVQSYDAARDDAELDCQLY